MRLLPKTVILAHRYLGIAIGLLVVMWFVSGIVMMYAGGMPRLTPDERLERLPDLDLSRIRTTPAEAGLAAGQDGSARVQLSTVLGRPAYRVDGVIVYADTGEAVAQISLEESRTIASRFTQVPEDRLAHVGTLTRGDQWTLQARGPLHKFRADDPDGTEIYVQPRTGEIATVTTRRSRMLAWLGVIPHWLYFSALREHQPLWYQLVVWTSGAACVLAALGLVLAFIQFRRTRPFRLARSIPYSGWMRVHYLTGAIFGVFALTWAFSGLLSMEPFAWTNATGVTVPGDALTGGRLDLSRFARPDPKSWSSALDGRAVREIEFARIQDEHYYVVRLAPPTPVSPQLQERRHQPYYVTGRVEPNRVLVTADTLQVKQTAFSTQSLLARLRTAVPEARIVESALLADYDSYYYSRSRQTPLPVLRVKFDDPAETWVYVDPGMSAVLAEVPRLARLERWLYNGLHSLDFAFWYNSRPLWDIGMITLLLGGLATTCAGLVMGVRRLRRSGAGAVTWWRTPPVERPAETRTGVAARRGERPA